MQQLWDAVPGFIERHWPKNDTAAEGGAPTPGRGDATRLHQATGWEPHIPFRQTVADTLNWWQHELVARSEVADAPSDR